MRTWVFLCGLAVASLAGDERAFAQTDTAPGPQQLQPSTPSSRLPGAQRPAPQQRGTVPVEQGTPVRLIAYMHDGSPAITRGMVWRVFRVDGRAESASPVFVTESTEAQPSLRLRPGRYMVTAAYGRASVAKALRVEELPIADSVILNAGGLRLSASIGDRRLPEARVSYSVFLGPGPGGVAVVENVRGGRILRLPVGDYYVLSRYGDANALMSGDVRVQPGRLTDVTIHHRAAQVTLKLVSERGGEAIANTAWSVLTPGGDTVQESIGAFPSMVLASGDYTVIARNEGRVFNARFTVEPGQDREVEVLAR